MSRVVLAVLLLASVAVAGLRSVEAQGSAWDFQEAQYLGRELTLTSMLSASFARVDVLNETLDFDDLEWRNDFLGETAVWRAVYTESLEIYPTPRYRDYHDAMGEAYVLLDRAAVQARAAIEAPGPDGFAVAAQTINRVHVEMAEANDVLAAIEDD